MIVLFPMATESSKVTFVKAIFFLSLLKKTQQHLTIHQQTSSHACIAILIVLLMY